MTIGETIETLAAAAIVIVGAIVFLVGAWLLLQVAMAVLTLPLWIGIVVLILVEIAFEIGKKRGRQG